MAHQRDLSFVPQDFLAKLYFLFYLPFYVGYKFLGKVQFLRKLLQPYTGKPLHRFAIYKWNEIAYVAKCQALSSARTVTKGMKFKDIPLYTLDKQLTSLAQVFDHRPLVLNFGSLPEYNQMVDKYSDTVKFAVIYIREAHPTNGEWPDEEMIQLKSHVTLEERLSAAKQMSEYDIKGQLLVDSMSDCCVRDYGALPERLFVIGADGHVVYDADMGPWGYSLAEVEAVLQMLHK